MTKRIYEKPTLAKRDVLSVIAAAPRTSATPQNIG
jgi:hypothetical protein